MRIGKAVVVAAILLVGTSARAVEGAVQYPHGAEGILAGAVPPPGVYGLAYGIHYSGVRKDARGDTVLAGAERVELGVDAIALRALWVSGYQLLGASWGMHVIAPFFTNTVSIGGLSNRNTGLGDVVIDPVILAWHGPNLHYAVGLDVILPTGAYSKTRPLGNNIGANYWSFEPLVAVTALPGAGWEIDLKAMYNIKTRNDATHYQSGDELHADFTVAKALTESFRLGLGGYWDHQIQGDRLNGADVGNRAIYFAVGPELLYQAGPVMVFAKFQQEVYARNAFQGSRAILKIAAPF
jgi:hypothetical protein